MKLEKFLRAIAAAGCAVTLATSTAARCQTEEDGLYRIDLHVVTGTKIDRFDQVSTDGPPLHLSTVESANGISARVVLGIECVTQLLQQNKLCKINGGFRPIFVSKHIKLPLGDIISEQQCSLSFNGKQIAIAGSRNYSTSRTDDCAPESGATEPGTRLTHANEIVSAAVDVNSSQLSAVGTADFSSSLQTKTCLSRTVSNGSHKIFATESLPLSYEGPSETENCQGPPLRAVALNPYRLLAGGAQTVNLDNFARAVDVPGSATASGMATDGTVRVVIAVRTTNSVTPVQFTLADPALGGLAPITSTMFSAPAPVDSSQEVKPNDEGFRKIPGAGNARAVMALLVAPNTPPNFTPGKPLTILVQQGTRKTSITVPLYLPPVLLVHGIWSDLFTWRFFMDGLSGGDFAFVTGVSYPNSVSFRSPQTQSAVKNGINFALQGARNRGIVAAQVTVVAHSMGGLVTRAWANDNAGFDGSDESFGKGEVGRLVTIDTPHLGSELARTLWLNKDVPMRRIIEQAHFGVDKIIQRKIGECQTPDGTFAQTMACLTMPVDGAVQDLIPESDAIANLPFPDAFPYEAVAGFYKGGNVAKTTFNQLLYAITKDSAYNVDALLGPKNDVLVNTDSQIAGASTYKAFDGVIHSKMKFSATEVLKSLPVREYVICRLHNRTNCHPTVGRDTGRRRTTNTLPGDFSLIGRTQISSEELVLSGIPFSGLNLNSSYEGAFSGASRSIESATYFVDQGNGIELFTGKSLTITPGSTAPISITAIAAFSDGTYALRSWTLRVNRKIDALLIELPQTEVHLATVGSTFQLSPIAYLSAPHSGILDIHSLANYIVPPGGSGIVGVDANGLLTGLSKGRTSVKVGFGHTTVSLNVFVGE